jgi:hypothetical protein
MGVVFVKSFVAVWGAVISDESDASEHAVMIKTDASMLAFASNKIENFIVKSSQLKCV